MHNESFTLAVLPANAKMPTRVDRFPNDLRLAAAEAAAAGPVKVVARLSLMVNDCP
ncbi:MAG TPA: hypothetical protein VES88_16480 [Gemmatimonadaceae bacterium]|nr:hypothetical protein [Gemmatimonadaceae bacterium]